MRCCINYNSSWQVIKQTLGNGVDQRVNSSCYFVYWIVDIAIELDSLENVGIVYQPHAVLVVPREQSIASEVSIDFGRNVWIGALQNIKLPP